jgi:type VI secretion system secreted protein VgrG
MNLPVKEHNLRLEVESKAPLDVRIITAREALNRPFEVEIQCVSPNHDLDLGAIVARPAAARITMVDGLHRAWSGVVSAMELIRWDPARTSQATYRVTLVDNLWLLSQRSGHRIFQHKKIPHIVDAILKEWKIEAEWKVDLGAYKEKEYCVQYGESDLDFVHRLVEEAGITYYYINKGAGGLIQSQIVFNDAPQSSARTVTLPWVDKPNEVGGKGFFTGVRLTHRHKTGLYTLGDYNFRKPKKPLFASSDKSAGIEGTREFYEFVPGHFLVETGAAGQGPSDEKVADDKSTTNHDNDDFGKKKAQRYLEALRNDKRQIRFHTSDQALRPGGVFAIDPHPHAEVDGKDMLCINTVCTVTAVGEWTVQGTGVFADKPYRPSRTVKKPVMQGVQVAIVTGPKGEEIYTDEFGRVRVRFLWDREGEFDDKSTCWLRVSQMWGGAQYGAVLLPRIGHEVVVDFYDGDPDQPVVVGRLHTVPAPQPYTLPKHKTRSTWQTNTTPNQKSGTDFNELLFEDKKDEELVRWQAQRNYMTLTKRNETERTGEDRLAVVGKHHLSVVREVDTVHASDQHLVRMVQPQNLKILEMEDPQFRNKDTYINMEGGMVSDTITITTGKAKIELSGRDIAIKADKGIRFSADRNLIVKGSMTFLNAIPAMVMPGRASSAVDDKIKKPEDDVRNNIEQLFSKDKKQAGSAQTKVKKIKGAVDHEAAMPPLDAKFGKHLAGKYLDKKGPLFKKPASPDDIKQGMVGDCYLLASLGAVAHVHPGKIDKMMKDNGDGTVTTTFENGKVPVTVDKEIPVHPGSQPPEPGKIKKLFGAKSPPPVPAYGKNADPGEQWVPIAEKSYAQQYGAGKGYEGIQGGANGNNATSALTRVNGGTTTEHNLTNGPTPPHIADALRGSSQKPTVASSTSTTGMVRNDHAYTVMGTRTRDDGTEVVMLRDPHGTSPDGSAHDPKKSAYVDDKGHAEVPVADFNKNFRRLRVNEPPP